jgi:heavy metal translocating P-type ATPase
MKYKYYDYKNSTTCDNCGGLLPSVPYVGRPWSTQPTPAHYCCYGCLALGEQKRLEQVSTTNKHSILSSISPSIGLRLGTATIIAAQTMIFSLALNLHNDIIPSVRLFVERIIIIGAIACMILLGLPLFLTTWLELKQKKMGTDSLFTLTLIGSFIASLYSHINHYEYTYFETVPIILITYTLGKILISHVKTVAINNTNRWKNQLATARKLSSDGQIISVPVEWITPGDLIQISPGEMIPVDGIVSQGQAYVFTGFINGEPFPTVRRQGDKVYAGEIIYDANLIIRASSRGRERAIDDILITIEQAKNEPCTLQRSCDNLSRLFTKFVICISILTFFYWYIIAEIEWHRAMYYSMSVLLVACPCIFGLVIPLIIWTAINRLVEIGFVLKSGTVIERLASVNLVAFDKTGTLTEFDDYSIKIISTLQDEKHTELVQQLIAIEEKTNHPIAKPFKNLKHTMQISRAEYNILVIQIPGSGIYAEIHDIKKIIFHIGNYIWVRQNANDDLITPILNNWYPNTDNYIYISRDYSIIAAAKIFENVLVSARQAIAELKQLGIYIYMLTGGNSDSENMNHISCDISYYNLLPLQKKQCIENMSANGYSILYVGDGINDIAAMSLAHVKMTPRHATDLNIHLSDIIMYHNNLSAIPWAIKFCRNAIDTIIVCLCMALAYNIIGIGLAASGYLHPIMATILMTLSSIWLILSASRLTKHVNQTIRECDDNYIFNSNDKYRRYDGDIKYLLLGIVHSLCLVIQILIIISFYDLYRYLYIIALSPIIAYIWYKWKNIPHHVDMSFSMLSVGNLGMLLGHLCDHSYILYVNTKLSDCSDIHDTVYSSMGMYIGMIICSIFAMTIMLRRPVSNGVYTIAMNIWTNIGMIFCMLLSNLFLNYYSNSYNMITHYLVMTLSCLIGMSIGLCAFNRIKTLLSRTNCFYLTK